MAGVNNGTKWMLLVNGKYIGFCLSHSITFESATRDISVRETDNWASYMHGMREYNIEVEGLWAQTDVDGTLASQHSIAIGGITYNIPPSAPYDVLSMGYGSQEKFSLGFVNWESGSMVWDFRGYFTSVAIDTPLEDSTTFNFSFKGLNMPRDYTVS
tara:strand:+ start:3434 stop:3904 length:471 start_codon:yes stop_codon:yes gene_type:complete